MFEGGFKFRTHAVELRDLPFTLDAFGRGQVRALVDVNNDGWLDLFVTRHAQCSGGRPTVAGAESPGNSLFLADGTQFVVDRAHDFFAIFMVQTQGYKVADLSRFPRSGQGSRRDRSARPRRDRWHGQRPQMLGKAGCVLASVNYRLAPAAKHPAHIEDVAQAILWLQTNAASYDRRARRACSDPTKRRPGRAAVRTVSKGRRRRRRKTDACGGSQAIESSPPLSLQLPEGRLSLSFSNRLVRRTFRFQLHHARGVTDAAVQVLGMMALIVTYYRTLGWLGRLFWGQIQRAEQTPGSGIPVRRAHGVSARHELPGAAMRDTSHIPVPRVGLTAQNAVSERCGSSTLSLGPARK